MFGLQGLLVDPPTAIGLTPTERDKAGLEPTTSSLSVRVSTAVWLGLKLTDEVNRTGRMRNRLRFAGEGVDDSDAPHPWMTWSARVLARHHPWPRYRAHF